MKLYIQANQKFPVRNFFYEYSEIDTKIIQESNYQELGLIQIEFPDPIDNTLRLRPVATKVDGVWVGSWEQVTEQLLKTEEDQRQARRARDARLAASDWTQVADAPVDKEAWSAYRQALRDVTNQPDFPYNITWPKEP